MPHTWRAYGDDAIRFQVTVTPGEFETFFERIAERKLTLADQAELAEVASAAGMTARARRLLYEARNPVAQRVDLEHQPNVKAVLFPEFDKPIEDRLPVSVAGEIIIGDEEARDALRRVRAHNLLYIVGCAITRLATLHVDDSAEAALEWTAAPGVPIAPSQWTVT